MTTKVSLPPTTIPPGSWILITGVTGYVASHIALEFLKRGYRVRGTTRDVSTSSWVTTSLFKSQTEAGFFELASVPDMAAPGSFDQAIKGVSAVVHVASVLSYDGNPHNVITPTVEGTKNLLRVAAREISVKRFVYTGTIGATDPLTSTTPVYLTKDSWNEEGVDQAWKEPYGPEKGYINYVASKIITEKAVWKFVEEEKPGFELNVVCPYMNMGKVLDKNQNPGARTMMAGFVGGTEQTKALLAIIPNVAYINNTDDAIIHVGAVLDPEVKNERIYAWAHKFVWNDVLAIMRKMFPDKAVIEDLPDPKMCMAEADMSLALSLLKKWGPQEGWMGFEQGVREILEDVTF
ncbi:related to NADPH-dependent aldehyde reductase [Phialocephala subalpina]|uniref:Related to NADPH-dependent aldehyde reductase n=1 Tax=Phialocephala subalpina TaxID=576137 RepID=A0A1L7XQ71_9HELO|nr:related to NADPH-dependent aldehyde reductase [Phialocephala subalpina]